MYAPLASAIRQRLVETLGDKTQHCILVTARGAMALLLTAPLFAQSSNSFRYFYDDLGQLTRVIDASGNEVDYIYDAVGNIGEIKRSSAPVPGTLAILNFTPQQGAVGDTVIIQGQGFGATPAANTVRFNGIAATVLSATPTTLTVTVPNGATTGPLAVTVLAATATSGTNFTVLPVPVITSLSRKSALFNTVIPNLGVTGANLAGATFSFDATALTVTGVSTNPSGLSANLSVQVRAVAGTFALIARNSFGSSTPGITRSNRFTVVNPNSTADSDGDGVPDAVEAAFGTDPLDPSSVPNASFPPSGEVNPIAFSVLNTAGQPTSREADATVFSALNLAGVTGGRPIRMEADAPLFSVLNTEGSGGGGQPVAMEADGLTFSVLNLAGVSGGQPMQMEADGIPFSVRNVNPNAPLGAKDGASLRPGHSASAAASQNRGNALSNGRPLTKPGANDSGAMNTSESSKVEDSDPTRSKP